MKIITCPKCGSGMLRLITPTIDMPYYPYKCITCGHEFDTSIEEAKHDLRNFVVYNEKEK